MALMLCGIILAAVKVFNLNLGLASDFYQVSCYLLECFIESILSAGIYHMMVFFCTNVEKLNCFVGSTNGAYHQCFNPIPRAFTALMTNVVSVLIYLSDRE